MFQDPRASVIGNGLEKLRLIHKNSQTKEGETSCTGGRRAEHREPLAEVDSDTRAWVLWICASGRFLWLPWPNRMYSCSLLSWHTGTFRKNRLTLVFIAFISPIWSKQIYPLKSMDWECLLTPGFNSPPPPARPQGLAFQVSPSPNFPLWESGKKILNGRCPAVPLS